MRTKCYELFPLIIIFLNIHVSTRNNHKFLKKPLREDISDSISHDNPGSSSPIEGTLLSGGTNRKGHRKAEDIRGKLSDDLVWDMLLWLYCVPSVHESTRHFGLSFAYDAPKFGMICLMMSDLPLLRLILGKGCSNAYLP